MHQEDDLRALAKVMDFMRAISILFVIINIYWFCYAQLREWNLILEIVDKILLNFNRTTNLFSNILWTKLFAALFLALSCLGTKGIKEEKITWRKIVIALSVGCILFFFNGWLLESALSSTYSTALYVLTMALGYLCMLAGGVWMSRLLKSNLMEDVFNVENESFQQETRLIENEYSINLPTRFYYQKRWNDGWINVVNPFRGRRRTNRVIFVKLIYWLKLNVNHLKSVIWVKQRKITGNIRNGMTSGWLGTLVGNSLFCFPEFPRKLRTLNGFNPIILPQFGTRN